MKSFAFYFESLCRIDCAFFNLKVLSYIDYLLLQNMQKTLLLICSVTLSLSSYSQQNTVASGGDGSGSGGTFSYSIGQIDYINVSSTLSISEGVQQPYEYYEVVGLSNLNPIITSIYPNPATESILLEIGQLENDLSYDLFDLKGKLIEHADISATKTSIDIQPLAKGAYILEVSQTQHPITTLKFIKH
ncbi:MAG: hypothetical protein ACI865_000579 [Flavobacteriaceae bacterium]|jgi:hypothetical protein